MKYTSQINEDIKQAMLQRQKDKLEALRSVKTAFTLARTSKSGGVELSDEEEIKIMQKLVKQRNESAAIYSQQKRPELAEKEILEAGFIEAYLPVQLGEEEIRTVLKGLIAENSIGSMADMGKLMGLATKAMAGKADGKMISSIVRELLS